VAELNPTELYALISLLDDPDEGVFHHIKEKILSLGYPVIPYLENAWETSFDTLLQNRIENIIHTIQFDSVSEDLKNWYLLGGQNLLFGALLIAKYQYPDLNEEKIKKHIEQIKQDIWLELNSNLTALEKVKIINHIFFEVHGLSGNTTNFHAPQNSYINNVLESKKGNPLSLSILYAIIAQNLDIPIYGVNLPEHFVLGYTDEHSQPATPGQGNCLFYINAFSRGSVFGKKEIDTFLKQLKLEARAEYYEPCSNVEIIKRLIRNLIFSFEKSGYPEKTEEMKKLLACLQP